MVTNHGRTNINTSNNNNGGGNTNSPASSVSIAATHYGTTGIQSTILPTTTDASGNILPPQGAEIKIPAVGATPVAVSTKLPAAVQQLSQQGMFLNHLYYMANKAQKKRKKKLTKNLYKIS